MSNLLRKLLRREKQNLGPDPELLQIPRLLPVQLPGLQHASVAANHTRPRVAGDFYDFLLTGSSWLAFVLIDVAGRRDQALPVIVAVQESFRRKGSELFKSETANLTAAMSALLMELNRTIMTAAGHVRCAPAFIGCYQDALGVFCYINAGHMPGLWKDEEGITPLEANGIPLGCFSHSLYDPKVRVLRPGTTLLLVSKGVVESMAGETEFGIDGVQNLLLSRDLPDADLLASEVLGAAAGFPSYKALHNDLSVVAVVRKRDN
jgi:serine phosphatase RsbU (regulator of sigma subunit)